MRFPLITVVLITIGAAVASAQVASHASTIQPRARLMESAPPVISDKPVAKVNDAVLTDRDLLREMYAIFPYAKQHNGFPKGMEPEIRKGALQMIIFEELVYQEAQRRKMVITPEKLNQAVRTFRKEQFKTSEGYQAYLQQECKGSVAVLRQKVRRALMIQALLQAEVDRKAVVTPAAARAYYDKNPQQFQKKEMIHIQTISIMPPQSSDEKVQKEAKQRAEDALKQAKATKNYREFGLLAEKLSDDDWHVNMGDRKLIEAGMLPPPIVEAARKMKPGDVSDLLQFGSNYTLFRLNEYSPAGKATYAEVRQQLKGELEKTRVSQLRSELNKRLQKTARIEVL